MNLSLRLQPWNWGHYYTDSNREVRGGHVSTIGALGLEGLRTGLRVPGAVDGDTMLFFIEKRLVPTLKRGDLVCMDNNPIHKLEEIEDAIEAAGAWTRPFSFILSRHRAAMRWRE